MLKIEVVTPEALLVSDEATMIIVPGSEGDFGVLENHAPLIATLRQGLVTVEHASKSSEIFFVTGGVAEVGNNLEEGSRCTILAEQAKPLSAYNRAEVEEEIKSIERKQSIAETETEKHSLEKALLSNQTLLKILEGGK